MLLEFEILEIYGNELKNGRCPEEIRKDLFIIMDFLNEPTTSNYMIKNGPRDIDSTASFYYDNEFDIAAGNLSPDKIKEIYTHLKIIANDVVISHRNMLTELYFKMLKFQFVPKSQTYHTMRAVVDQYHSLNHYDSDDPYVKYVINTFTPEMVERCFEIAREDLIRIYELDVFAIPKNSTKYCSFDSIKNEEFDIYNFVEKHSIIGKVCEVL